MTDSRSGSVVQRAVNVGTKSERADAVVLETDDGDWFVLRRRGGNPFRNDGLEELVGKAVEVTGSAAEGHTFLLDSWADLSPG